MILCRCRGCNHSVWDEDFCDVCTGEDDCTHGLDEDEHDYDVSFWDEADENTEPPYDERHDP